MYTSTESCILYSVEVFVWSGDDFVHPRGVKGRLLALFSLWGIGMVEKHMGLFGAEYGLSEGVTHSPASCVFYGSDLGLKCIQACYTSFSLFNCTRSSPSCGENFETHL